MKLNSAGALNEEHAQIAIATLGDAAKYRSNDPNGGPAGDVSLTLGNLAPNSEPGT